MATVLTFAVGHRAGMLLAILLALWIAPVSAGATTPPPHWRRGINLAEYLAYPQDRSWPFYTGPRATTSDEELARLRAAGFDFIRLPVLPNPFLEAAPAEVARLEERLTSFVTRANRAGLAVMVTSFPRDDPPRWSAAAISAGPGSDAWKRYLALLERHAKLLAAFPVGRVALAPMNEPQPECRRTRGPDWTVLQREIYASVRRIAPDLLFVVTGGCWSGRDGLAHLDMSPYDARTLVDVHFYEPFSFTHQSATWTLPELRSLAGLSFPASRTRKEAASEASARLFNERFPGGTAADLVPTLKRLDQYLKQAPGIETIEAAMAGIGAWADRQKVQRQRIIIGEFGVIRLPEAAGVADDGSRTRWLGTVRQAAERQRFGWALWSYHGSFGLVLDDATGRLDGEMLKALGLSNLPHR